MTSSYNKSINDKHNHHNHNNIDKQIIIIKDINIRKGPKRKACEERRGAEGRGEEAEDGMVGSKRGLGYGERALVFRGKLREACFVLTEISESLRMFREFTGE